ncbi:MAG: hypothetical protein ABR515_07245 [Nitrososphaeraceae archaeon]
MKAARIVNPKKELEIQKVRTPAQKGSQVYVKVQSLKLCHRDIHLWHGGYEGASIRGGFDEEPEKESIKKKRKGNSLSMERGATMSSVQN